MLIKVNPDVARQSAIIGHMLDDTGYGGSGGSGGGDGDGDGGVVVPLPNLSGETLTKIMNFCEFQTNSAPTLSAGEVKAWHKSFCEEGVSQSLLFDIILGANYLDVPALLNAACTSVAASMKGLTTQQMRDKFHIKNDFTPEEEAEIDRENQWMFD